MGGRRRWKVLLQAAKLPRRATKVDYQDSLLWCRLAGWQAGQVWQASRSHSSSRGRGDSRGLRPISGSDSPGQLFQPVSACSPKLRLPFQFQFVIYGVPGSDWGLVPPSSSSPGHLVCQQLLSFHLPPQPPTQPHFYFSPPPQQRLPSLETISPSLGRSSLTFLASTSRCFPGVASHFPAASCPALNSQQSGKPSAPALFDVFLHPCGLHFLRESVTMAPEPTPDNADHKKKAHLM